jgi:hypothetical protein
MIICVPAQEREELVPRVLPEPDDRAPGCVAAEKRSSTVPPGLRPAAMRRSRGSIHLPTVAALPPSLVRCHDQPFCTASTDSPQLSLFRNFAITLTRCSRPDSVERRLPDDAANDRPTKRNVHWPIPVPCRSRPPGWGWWGWDCSRGRQWWRGRGRSGRRVRWHGVGVAAWTSRADRVSSLPG